jgi:hypothetical protein
MQRGVNVFFTDGFATELSGSDYRYRAQQAIERFLCVYGGVSWQYFPTRETFFTTMMARWFTSSPNPKRTDKRAHEFLTFYAIEANTLYLKGTITYKNGDTINVTYSPSSGIDVEANQFYTVDVSYHRIVVPVLPPAKEVASWSVYLLTGDGDLAGPEEPKIYKIDDANCLAPRHYLLFGNSIGGWDTLVCTQYATHGLSANRSILKTVIPKDYTANDAPETVFITQTNKSIKLGTGFVQKDEIVYLQDLLISDQVYYCDYDSVAYVPVRITDNNIQQYQEGDLYALVFSIEFLVPANQFNLPL